MTRSTPPGFFDALSGSPLSDVARQALLQGIDLAWAHPGRLHHPGRVANQLLQAARQSCGQALGFQPHEVVFVQSISLAFRLALGGLIKQGTKVITSTVEQSFLLNDLEALPAGQVSFVDVDDVGRVNAADFQAALSGGVGQGERLAILQLANHEVGTRQPWAEIDFGSVGEIYWLTDATVGAGLEPPPSRVDVAVANPSSWGGPLGLAILCVRERVHFSLKVGLGQGASDGRGLQALLGEPNVGLALACAASLEQVASQSAAISQSLGALSQQLRAELQAEVKDLVLLGQRDVDGSTPGLVGFSLLYVDGEALLQELAKADVAVTSGSSCVADAIGPSHVLAAMGALSHGNVRVSIPIGATSANVSALAQAIAGAAKKVKDAAGVDYT